MASNVSPLPLSTSEDFQKAINTPTLSVVHFYAEWLEQCEQINQYLTTLSKRPESVGVQFYKVAAEDLSDVSLKYEITAAPTTLFFISGKEVDRINGIDTMKIYEYVKKHNKQSDNGLTPQENLNERLKNLVNKAKVMLFMKGTKDSPRCGFSKTIVQILNDTGVVYETFDIMTDEEVRQGLKVYSDWPTYPQLYIKGELVGGLDIVKEMVQSGELREALNA